MACRLRSGDFIGALIRPAAPHRAAHLSTGLLLLLLALRALAQRAMER